ncbi:hypothetical protein COV16_03605 [Candidatus Woesearchaeota archaeon CG10_big_fil_rev_8_21_14_0_10_34_8]|nr:MAG: hypothetical protein COV16_03605 [Candidatus Woesearchaeota archaeon CG10_big_fil_rev_8_21_14_0_10_34_8]
MKKKGQGLSVNVIIVAVLALLVLVVIAFIFTGKLGKFSTATADCEAIAGNVCDYSCDQGYVKDSTRGCYEDNELTNQVCCIPVAG